MGSSTPHRYRAILWDNDGVLVDTERWYFRATRDVLASVGVELTDDLFFTFFLTQSGGAWHLAAERGASEAEIAELRRERNARYQRYLAEQELPMPYAEETLRALRPHFAMGVVTSAHRCDFEAIHRRTGFKQYFQFALTLEDCARSKPDPDPYRRGLARIGVSAAECLVIEDTPRGLAAAHAAGIDCWVIPTAQTRHADFSAASRVLRDLRDVASLLLPATAIPTSMCQR